MKRFVLRPTRQNTMAASLGACAAFLRLLGVFSAVIFNGNLFGNDTQNLPACTGVFGISGETVAFLDNIEYSTGYRTGETMFGASAAFRFFLIPIHSLGRFEGCRWRNAVSGYSNQIREFQCQRGQHFETAERLHDFTSFPRKSEGPHPAQKEWSPVIGYLGRLGTVNNFAVLISKPTTISTRRCIVRTSSS